MECRSFIPNPTITMAGLTTAKTVAAISSIQIVGNDSINIFNKIFKPSGKKYYEFSVGNILHGNIFDGDKNIDEVVIGCEGEDSFSINCHGNPIIVENILELLKKHGAKITEAKEIISYLARKKYGDNTIAIEAEIASTQAATLDGAKIIQYQTKMGLLQTAEWLAKNIDTMDVDDVRLEALEILTDSKIASYFINGVKVVLAGPPNSGKSTLFNFLCGKEKAIVTDIAGTTRDWLSAKIRLRKIQAEIFDTAGLDKTLSEKNIIDEQSQSQATELIKNADVVLFVLDAKKLGETAIRFARHKIIVLNKCDLLNDLFVPDFPEAVKISAKTGSGVKELVEEIETVLGAVEFDMKKTVCFTDRQEKIMQLIVASQDKNQIKKLIQELLKSGL